MFLRLCFVERYLAILGCNHLDQHSHLHLPLALLKLHKKSDYKLKCRFCSSVGSDSRTDWSLVLRNFQQKASLQNLSQIWPHVLLELNYSSFVLSLSFSFRIPWLWRYKKDLRFDYWIEFYLVFKIKLSIKPPQFKWSKFWINQLFMKKSGDWIFPSQK